MVKSYEQNARLQNIISSKIHKNIALIEESAFRSNPQSYCLLYVSIYICDKMGPFFLYIVVSLYS